MQSEVNQEIPASVYRALRAYLQAIERRQWNVLPPVNARNEDQMEAGDLRSLIVQVAQAAGWSGEALPRFCHGWVMSHAEQREGKWVVFATTEIQVMSRQGDLFLW